ncbi:MAG TPA: DUF3566 domain-containing protein [Candidatus Rothia avicola]|uniref:DUF3566 domain-containing protein n=1 Tax=Candidatus Rothia avicola TaxID=2840478 RepID=A0A9D1ZTZ2_9MICC|nr:DUF3566 domain-containing protein [Candidatus Rothia avicola]
MSTKSTRTAPRPAPRVGTPRAAQGKARPQKVASAGAQRKPLVRPAPRSKIRRARLVVAKVDTFSVAKLVFLLSVAIGIATVVAAVILWLVMQATGAFQSLNDLLTLLGTTGDAVDISQYLSLGQVALYSTIISVVNVVLFTLLGTLAAMLYNVAAKLVGGVGVTLTDE